MFWQPVYRAQDLGPGQAVPLRIMSEDITLYRGEGGTPHVLAFRCAHRGTQLSTGRVEGDCIRCLYHGWRYDSFGQCVEQPGEEESFAKKVRIRSYPTQEYLGLIFAYLGEGEAPPLRRYPDLEGEGVLETLSTGFWPCNYFNVLDNACDAGHIAFVHRESRLIVNRPDRLRVPKIFAEETEYGIRTTTANPGERANVLHFHMPNINQIRSVWRYTDSMDRLRNGWVDRLFFRVPVDDENCVNFVVDRAKLKGTAARGYREQYHQMRHGGVKFPAHLGDGVLAGKLRIEDFSKQTSPYYLTLIEDYLAQVGQGPVASLMSSLWTRWILP